MTFSNAGEINYQNEVIFVEQFPDIVQHVVEFDALTEGESRVVGGHCVQQQQV